MRVRFFIDNMLQTMYDNLRAQFTPNDDLPPPTVEFFIYHFRQAVLANMKGTRKVTVYYYEPTDDAQSMSVFVTGEGKEYFEGFLEKKLLDHDHGEQKRNGKATSKQ